MLSHAWPLVSYRSVISFDYHDTINQLGRWKLNPANRPSESIDKVLESGSLGTILLDFLHYYGTTFPYDDSYISVTQGKLLPKESADWISDNGRRDKLVIQCLVDPGKLRLSFKTRF
jgi:Cid1 family poly A polymerase